MLNDGDRKVLEETFKRDMAGDVSLMYFTDSKEKCEYCGENLELLKELSSIDSRIKLTVYDINEHRSEAKFLGVDSAPSTVIGGKRIYGVIYKGIPAGHEFSSLVGDIIDASRNSTTLSENTKKKLEGLKKHVDIKVFVTPTCPWCPKAVRIAHQFAMENKFVRSSMIEASEFMDLAKKYAVMGVPKIVINDKYSFEGAQPEEVFLNYVMASADDAA
ncbi:thioredoxin family protein [Candidatus Marsarchaeota archaeon]|jgi:glutaredoxin-like protein|nr:thioredoxin family protein [Candidatus Marsarchaeota archaeon]